VRQENQFAFFAGCVYDQPIQAVTMQGVHKYQCIVTMCWYACASSIPSQPTEYTQKLSKGYMHTNLIPFKLLLLHVKVFVW